MVSCIKCGEELVVGDNWYESFKKQYHYRCIKCDIRQSTERHRRNGVKPMSENKECASYLGVHIAEQMLSEVFKDVKRMPNNHPGYDFICNNDKKIDVKASCLGRGKNGKSDYWDFSIKRNGIPDYFLCIAFDDRENLNPLHLWLIPSEKVKHLSSAFIAVTRLNKWDMYRLEIEFPGSSNQEVVRRRQ